MKTAVYDQSGKDVGTVEVPDTVFGLKWNADLVHQVVESERASQRKNIAHVKTRGEVRGGGKKPWQQKGTGRARHGSIRSPLWRKGGVTHGPNPEKIYARKINKKMAQKALATVLSAKLRDREIVVMDDVSFPEGKTRSAVLLFRSFTEKKEFPKLGFSGGRTLVLIPRHDANAVNALRNIKTVGVKPAVMAQARDVLSYKYVMLPKESIEVLNKRISG